MRDSHLITSHLYWECLLFCTCPPNPESDFFFNFKIVPTSCYTNTEHSCTLSLCINSIVLFLSRSILMYLSSCSLSTHTHTHTHTHMTARLMRQLMEISFWLLTLLSLGFPGGSDGKESAYNSGDPGSIPGLGKSPREGNGNPLQYSCLENSMDRGAWRAPVRRVAESNMTRWLSTLLSLPPLSFPLVYRYWQLTLIQVVS